MDNETVFTALRRKIRAQMNELADVTALGNLVDWPSYQRVVGKIEGLAFAEAYIIELEQRLLKEE